MLYIFIYFLTKKESKYDAVLKIRKWAIVFILCIMISCIFTNMENTKYENKDTIISNSNEFTGIIISNPTEKEYSTQYLLKLTKVKDKSVDITVYLRVKSKYNLEYGDEIVIKGEYIEPDSARNDKGFNYRNYLKSNRDCWCN